MVGKKSYRPKRKFHFINGLFLALGLIVSSSCALLKSGLPNDKQEGREIIVNTKSMMVIVKLPVDYNPAKPYTLLVALHGNGGSAQGWAPSFNRYANEPFIVAIPQGAYQKPQGGFSWFYETTDRSLWKSYDTLAVTKLLEAVAEVSSRYPVKEKFILGFSQGAGMAYMAGILNPAIIRGVIAIGGVMPEIDREGSLINDSQVIRARGLKLLIARGNSDDLVNRQHFTDQRKYFRSKGYDVSSYEYQGGHSLTESLLGRIRRWLKKNSSSSPAAQDLE
ncbi:MAG: alpha/beta hydrolase-fold protein [Candidatus Aminicenantes bacterium]|nr:alpha/beta hydrolase-fold protein [Candidatus Aminicenantes bacterium]